MKSEHTPLTDEIVNALADGAVLSGKANGLFVPVAVLLGMGRASLGDHASVIVQMAIDLREARRLLRALCNETRGTISLERDRLMGLVGVTNVRVLERKMFEASDYLVVCEGKGEGR